MLILCFIAVTLQHFPLFAEDQQSKSKRKIESSVKDDIVPPSFISHTDYLSVNFGDTLLYQAAASGSQPVNYFSPGLPFNIYLSSSGKISSDPLVPPLPGIYNVTIQVRNSVGSDSMTLTINIHFNVTGTLEYSESDNQKMAVCDDPTQCNNTDYFFPSHHTLSVNATLNVPTGTAFSAGTILKLNVGQYQFYGSIDSANSFVKGKSASWNLTITPYKSGSLKLTYRDNKINIRLALREDDFYGTEYAVLGKYIGSTQIFSDTATASIVFGGHAAGFLISVVGNTKDKTVEYSKAKIPYTLYLDNGKVVGTGVIQQ
jgi:hypothetical protein